MEYSSKFKSEIRSSITDALNDMSNIRSSVSPKDFKALVDHMEELETKLFKAINKGRVERDLKLSIPSFKSKDKTVSSVASQLKLKLFKIITNHKVDCK